MMRYLLLITALLIGVLIIVATKPQSQSIYSHRYRLTIAIEIEGKVHSGSSVIEVRWTGGANSDGRLGFSSEIFGQAAWVDVGKYGVVVAALDTGQTSQDTPDASHSARWIAARAFGNDSTYQKLSELPTLRGRRDLAADNMPRLIWFSDINDLKTATRFLISDIPKLFGPTSRLSEASVEITTDPIEIDIDKKIPWLEASKRQTFDRIVQINYSFGLSRPMFIRSPSK